jgi:hypothetical protein
LTKRGAVDGWAVDERTSRMRYRLRIKSRLRLKNY